MFDANTEGTKRFSKRAVLISGSFNPITNGHLKMAELVSKHFEDADILFVPSNDEHLRDNKGYKEEDIIDSKTRFELTRKSIQVIPNSYLLDIEINHVVDGKTINTVQYLKTVLKYTEVFICFGLDVYAKMPKWYKGRELLNNEKFIVITRKTDEKLEVSDEVKDFLKRPNFFFLNEESSEGEISSSEIRKLVKSGKIYAIKGKVPTAVFDYYNNGSTKK